MVTSRGLWLVALLAVYIPANAQECSSFTRCADCLRGNPTCGWCNDLNAFNNYAANSTSLDPAPFCGTMEELAQLGCGQNNIINPRSTAETVPPSGSPASPGDEQVTPSAVDVTLRPGEEASFDITVSPAASISVDMYLVMDLTLTMQESLQMLRGFAGDLVATMQSLTDEFQIAFGSFADKRVYPFGEALALDFPCVRDSMGNTALTPATCDPLYAFRHRLDFTTNVTEFQAQVDQAQLTASLDEPEAILDAIMQIALCEDELGWSPTGQSRRLILALTDGDYHYALDGRLGGITTRPDKQCHLDPITREYTYNDRQDYPSATFIADLLNERRIIPIFAVTQDLRPVYTRLTDVIRSAFVGQLSSNSDNLLDLIVDQYNALSSTVVPVISGLDPSVPITLTVLPADNCSPGTLRETTEDTCENVTSPNSVVYTVTASVGREICDLNLDTIPVQIQFIGFGQVDVNIALHCDCNCDPPQPNSPECDSRGTLECSTCDCPSDRAGPKCTCPVSASAIRTCSARPSDPICSGRGTCVCGECMCDPISEGSEIRFQGQFCESNPLDCPTARNNNGVFAPCADNGVCIDSRCVCNEGFTGAACECTLDTSTCRGPLDNESSLCSHDEGACVCGLCICNDYTQRIGQFCEECVPCRGSCQVISECVRCLVERGVSCDPDDRCEDRIDFRNESFLVPGLKQCSLIVDGCEVRYSVDPLFIGDEDPLFVIWDPDQRSIRRLMSDPDECKSSTLIWPIPVGIVLGIIVVGVIAIAIWRCITYIGEYLEYQEWVRSLKEETSKRGSNPLFVDPNTKHQNPRYRPVQ